MVSHIGHGQTFLGLYKDVEVAVSDLKTRYSIFMMETGDHDLVLGQPFLNTIKFHQNYKPDGVFDTIIYPKIQKSAVFRTLSPWNPANWTETYIFP